MSFLFGKKKQGHGGLPPATRDTHTSDGPNASEKVNGVKARERGPGTLSPTPQGGSVNNSINSVGGFQSPSPERGQGPRLDPDQDMPVGCALDTGLYKLPAGRPVPSIPFPAQTKLHERMLTRSCIYSTVVDPA